MDAMRREEEPEEGEEFLSRDRRNQIGGGGEKRTQKAYHLGICLVCIGATLNWLSFAHMGGWIDGLRWIGVSCIICGSLCVSLAMCRWLGQPINIPLPHPTQTTPSTMFVSLKPPPPYHTLPPPIQPPTYEQAIQIQPPPPPIS